MSQVRFIGARSKESRLRRPRNSFLRRFDKLPHLKTRMNCPLATVPLPPAVGFGSPPDDLLSRCADGNEVAWNNLYAQHRDTARGFLYRLGVRDHQLEDACQEVFLEAFRYLPEFRRQCSFKTWLYRLCATQARKVRTKQRVGDALSRLLPWELKSTVGDAGCFPCESEKLVEAALNALSQGERLVFVLYEFEGLSGKDIAEVANCTEASVWRRLHYARKKFCRHVEERGGVA